MYLCMYTIGECEMKLNCQKCDYTWDYNGESEYYTSCPRCLARVNVKKRRVDE